MSSSLNGTAHDQDDAAAKLAELSVKRNRTLADIDALHASIRSTRRALEGFGARQEETLAVFTTQLEGEHNDEALRALLTEWQEALLAASAEFKDLLAELERAQTQETILVQMLIQLDKQIDDVSLRLEEEG
jgi:hypothetical protein